jgi:hypothetical protein
MDGCKIEKYYVHRITGLRYTENEFIKNKLMPYRKDYTVKNMLINNEEVYDLDYLLDKYIVPIHYQDKRLYQIKDIEFYAVDENSMDCIAEAIDEDGEKYYVIWTVINPDTNDFNMICDWGNYEIEKVK